MIGFRPLLGLTIKRLRGFGRDATFCPRLPFSCSLDCRSVLLGFVLVIVEIALLQRMRGKLYLYVAIDRTSKFAFVQLVKKTGRTSASAFLEALIAAVPYKIHTVLTDNVLRQEPRGFEEQQVSIH